MTDRKKIRIILIGNRYYSGYIISEDNLTITIIDKFGKEVTFGKQQIISMEEIE